MEHEMKMEEAIEVCKEWKIERDWCIKNGINI
jgi:hypothetical protein